MGPLVAILKIRLPQALRTALEQLAEETGRSKSDCVRQAISELLERVKKTAGPGGLSQA